MSKTTKIITMILILLLISGFIFIGWGHKIPLIKNINSKSLNKLRCYVGFDKSLCIKDQIENKVPMYIKSFDIDTQLPINSKFLLKQDKNLIVEGELNAHYWEQLNLDFNKSYQLIALDDNDIQPDYYANNIECTTFEQENYCRIYLRKEGNANLSINRINNNRYLVRIHVTDGYFNNPMICFKWKPFGNILDASFENEENKRELIFELDNKWEKCSELKTIESARLPPLSISELSSEIINLHKNCSYKFRLNYSDTIEMLRQMKNDCNKKPKMIRDDILYEYKEMYSSCLVQEKSQKDVINSIVAYYDLCEMKEIKQKEIYLNITLLKDFEKYDKMDFYLLDKGYYIDGKEIIESYFGIEEKDIGSKNSIFSKKFI